MTCLLSTDAFKGRKGEDLRAALPVFAGAFPRDSTSQCLRIVIVRKSHPLSRASLLRLEDLTRPSYFFPSAKINNCFVYTLTDSPYDNETP